MNYDNGYDMHCGKLTKLVAESRDHLSKSRFLIFECQVCGKLVSTMFAWEGSSAFYGDKKKWVQFWKEAGERVAN